MSNTRFLCSADSGSSCSLAAGLESLGLTDIRTLVRLMCLAAAGRAGLSTSPTAGSGHAERPRGAAKASKPISCLAYLSTAVGCLASNSPNAAKLLVQLCTQVHISSALSKALLLYAQFWDWLLNELVIVQHFYMISTRQVKIFEIYRISWIMFKAKINLPPRKIQYMTSFHWEQGGCVFIWWFNKYSFSYYNKHTINSSVIILTSPLFYLCD